MLVLDGKKLSFVMIGIFLSVFGLMAATNTQNTIETVPTVTLPVSDKTIVIDARTWQAR